MTKTVKCSDTVAEGGCDMAFTADTPEDMKAQLGAHAGAMHADMIEHATDEDMKKWSENFDTNVWPNAAEA